MENLKKRFSMKQVLDGGVSTEIAFEYGHGYIDRADFPLWSSELLLTHPEVIKTVHKSFLASGSDVIGTITYQASIEGFVKHRGKSEKEAFDLMKRGAELAVEARDEYWAENEGKCSQKEKPLIAGALGPYGTLSFDGSEYRGDYIDTVSKEAIRTHHEPRIAALLEGGVDLIAFETVPALEEGLIFADLLASKFPNTPAWLAFSCKDEKHISHGEPFKDSFQHMLKYDQIFGVGINCTPPQYITALLQSVPEEMRKQKTMVVYPNSGEIWGGQDHKWHKRGDIPEVANFVSAWLKEGALWIGGCCRTTPKDISEIRTNMNI